jgi:nitronate monooxygenase
MVTVQSVTTLEEARRAADAGVDALAVQALAAGGHSATLDPWEVPHDLPLSQLVRAVGTAVSRPVLGAGGLSTPEAVAETIGAGAEAVMVGTALLLADESGASEVHRTAVADPSGPATVMTRAFTGRPARGIENRFIRAYEPMAPLGYPALHHLTIGLRRAAAAAGQADLVHLWAGRGYRDSVGGPTAGTLDRLAGRL